MGLTLIYGDRMYKKAVMMLCALGVSSQFAFAVDGYKHDMKMKMPEMTAEQRTKMADAHEKMAICLRSDKAMSDCHKEMMKACNESMGNEGCPMMSGKGMQHDKMMHSESQ
jgi:hypothetical protein